MHKHICRQTSASVYSTQAPRQPNPLPSCFFDGASDHLGSWVLPSRAFKEAGTSSSVSPCLTPQTTVLYHQVNYRTTLGQSDNPNLIFLILPCLFSSFSKVYEPPPSFSLRLYLLQFILNPLWLQVPPIAWLLMCIRPTSGKDNDDHIWRTDAYLHVLSSINICSKNSSDLFVISA